MNSHTYTPSTINFFINECNVVHALCDRAGVPRVSNEGSLLSMSQRVAILEGVQQGLMKRIGRDTPPLH